MHQDASVAPRFLEKRHAGSATTRGDRRMRRSLVRLLLATVLAGGSLVAIGGVSSAAPDDGPAADVALRAIEASPKKASAEGMVARAKAARERATRLREAGDEAHAKIADAVARTWAEAGREVVRAAELEEKANAARRDAVDAGASGERERAILEEAVAQSGRLRAQLEGESRDVKDPARTNVAGAASDAGAAPPRTPKSEVGPKGEPMKRKPEETKAPKPDDKPAERPAARDGGVR